MTNIQPQHRYEIDMVGLCVMGRNLLLNMADHGFSVAGYDKDPNKVEALRKESADLNQPCSPSSAEAGGQLLSRRVQELAAAAALVHGRDEARPHRAIKKEMKGT